MSVPRCPALLISLLLAEMAPMLASDVDEEEDVCVGGPESCAAVAAANATSAAAASPLHWRYQSYHPDRYGKIYGGSYVSDSLGERFGGPVEHDDWDVLWSSSYETGELEKRKLPWRPGRLVNKCRYFRAAGNKCYFAGHVRRVDRVLREEGKNFSYLRNWVITHKDQHLQWREEVLAAPERPWVVKKCASGMSQGVALLSGEPLVAKANERTSNQWTVAQAYLEKPFLFDGRKCHLRVYVLVTHWGPPARVFIYDEGVVFLGRKKYDHNGLSQADIFSSIDGVKADGVTHTVFWEHLEKQLPGSRAKVHARMAENIGQIFSTAMHESFGEDRIRETYPAVHGYQCFDLFGLDVMFDEDLTPFVLEVNMGPNLNIGDRGEENEGLLEGIKKPMIDQMVHWMDLYSRGATAASARGEYPEAFDPEAAEREGLTGFTRVV